MVGVTILRGEFPKEASYGSGSGDGSGDGYGYGYGNGYGYGYGYGSGDGYGYGSGDGYGYGDGDGYGDGYGDGDGYGSGDGSGDGYGDGYGYGSGDGSGYGDGYGSGDGYGDGDGYGYGSGDGDGYGYWLATIPSLIAGWTGEMRARADAATAAGATLAFWRSHKDGTPANGGRGGPRKAGDVEKIPGPLQLCGGGALHATLEPGQWQGARVWLVALYGEVIATEDKLGALHREILGEAWCSP